MAVVHHRDAVRHRQRLTLVVGDIDERDADLALDPLQLDLHVLAELQVERAEWLVEEQCPGVVHQRAGQRDPLLLTTGELARAALLAAAEVDDAEHLVDSLVDLGLRHTLAAQPERDVLNTLMCGNNA